MKTLYSKNLIPPLVLDGLKLLGKLGVMERETWIENFSYGTLNWKFKQLKKLIDANILKTYPSPSIQNRLILGKRGIDILKNINSSYVSPPYAGQVDHDSSLAKILLILNQKFKVHDFWVEKEIKSLGRDYYFFYSKSDDQKFSDALLDINLRGKNLKLAVEYERTGKSIERCESILKSYSCLEKIDFVLFIVENKMIRERFMELLRRKSFPLIEKKIGFILFEEIMDNSLNQGINRPSGYANFADTFENILNLRKIA